MSYNDRYSPSCATDCADQTLAATGNTNCPSNSTLEIAEINVLHLDEKDPAAPGDPKNPILTWTEDADNEAVILTWRAAHDNTTAGKVRTYSGEGEKPESTSTTVTLHKGKQFDLEERHVVNFTIKIIDTATYKALRTLQSCKGQYHAWFGTDQFLYGGDKGLIIDIQKVKFTKTGGRGNVGQCVITFAWNADADPVRDPLPYEVV